MVYLHGDVLCDFVVYHGVCGEIGGGTADSDDGLLDAIGRYAVRLQGILGATPVAHEGSVSFVHVRIPLPFPNKFLL